MDKNIQKLYSKLSTDKLAYISLNIMLSEISKPDDGILKRKELSVFPEDYYNRYYGTRRLSRESCYKMICMKHLLP